MLLASEDIKQKQNEQTYEPVTKGCTNKSDNYALKISTRKFNKNFLI